MAPRKKDANGLFRADGDDVAVVEPDALEDEAEQLAFGVRVFLDAPEDAEVVEHSARQFDVRSPLRCE